MTIAESAPTATVPLSVAMRDGSRAQHEAAESSVFIEELMGGRVSAAGYVAYLRSLREVYLALEETGRALAGHPIAGQVVDPALDRVAAIDADIATWSTGDAAEDLTASQAATAYAEMIRATVDQPEAYVAHHYTRYLGDLSGGQAIGRVLDREFALEGRGTDFYRFESIPKVKLYKDDYRARVDGLPVGQAQASDIVRAVQQSFSCNQAIFAELAQHMPAFARSASPAAG